MTRRSAAFLIIASLLGILSCSIHSEDMLGQAVLRNTKLGPERVEQEVAKAKSMLDEAEKTGAPNANALSYLGMVGLIRDKDEPFLKLVGRLNTAQPERFADGIRLDLAQLCAGRGDYTLAVEYLLPLCDVVRTRAVLWEALSSWTFRNADPPEREGLVLLTEIYCTLGKLDEALQTLRLMQEFYPFRVETVEAFTSCEKAVHSSSAEKTKQEWESIKKTQQALASCQTWKLLGIPQVDIGGSTKESSPILENAVSLIKLHAPEGNKTLLVAHCSDSRLLAVGKFVWKIDGECTPDPVFPNAVIIDTPNETDISVTVEISVEQPVAQRTCKLAEVPDQLEHK
jgi:hypothetical protein